MRLLKLYLDEDAMDGDLLAGLRARGIDVTTAAEQHMIRRNDEDHLAFATELDRVVYSFNMGDFARLHAEWIQSGRSHAGLILARQKRFNVGDQIRRVRVSGARSAPDMVNRLEFLSN